MSTGPASGSSGAPRRGLGCLFAALGLAAFVGLWGVLLTSASMMAPGDGEVREATLERLPNATRKLAIVDIRGVMLDGSDRVTGRVGVTGGALKMLDRAREDDQVAGVLVRIDSPGGSVTDAELIHQRMRKLRDKGKTVLVLMGDLCASGGVYAAVAAQEIWALPTTVTGSIGVIITSLNLAELMLRHGVQDVSIMSGRHKASLSPTRPPDPESIALLREVVDSFHARFVKLVADGRSDLDEAAVRAFADGRIFTAEKAVELSLVDRIGDRDGAVERLRELTEGGPFNVVRYETTSSVFDLLRARLETPSPAEMVRSALTPRAMYLFAPYGLSL